MPTETFKVISNYKLNGRVILTTTVYRGDYERCLKFYANNKEFYRKRNQFLELRLNKQ